MRMWSQKMGMLSSHFFCSGIGARLFESDLAQPCLGVVQVSRCLPARTLSGHLPIRTPTYVLNNPWCLFCWVSLVTSRTLFPPDIKPRAKHTAASTQWSFPAEKHPNLPGVLENWLTISTPKSNWSRRSGPRVPGAPPFRHGVATSSVEICESGVRSPRWR